MDRGAWVAGRFEISEPAGKGATSRVYKARDLLSGSGAVALKLLSASSGNAVERFEREAMLLSTLSHPAIVSYVAHGRTTAGQSWLALEWLSGETLGDRLDREVLSIREALSFAALMLDGLATLHARGVVHRDVKPANIFLVGGRADHSKLLDLGIARFLNAPVNLTQTGQMIGTPAYLAPEQARGASDVDGKADIFALAVVLYRALSGDRPFVAPDALGVLLKILVEDAPALIGRVPDLPPALDGLIAEMMAKSPADRPDARQALERVQAISTALVRAEAHSARQTMRGVPPGRGLSLDERKTISLAVARCFSDDEEATRAAISRAESDIAALGAVLTPLADGSYLLSAAKRQTAIFDGAVLAARSALAFSSWVPEAAVAVTSVRADIHGGDPTEALGKAAERAAQLLSVGPCRSPRIDDTTRGLLGDRFTTSAEGDELLLLAERAGAEGHTTLLGRAVPCVGRDSEIALLSRVLSEAATEPRVMTLVGPAGSGKSRVAGESLRETELAGFTVYVARGDPMSPGAPLSLVSQIVRKAAGIDALEPKQARRQKLTRAAVAALSAPPPASRGARGTQPLEPSVLEIAQTAAFLGELCGTQFDDTGLPELYAARLDARLMGDRIERAFVTWLGSEARRGKLLLLLEDLHWGDLASARLISKAVFQLEKAPLGVLALARPDAPQELLSALGGARIDLEPLPASAAIWIARAGLGEDCDEALLERVVERAAGNAFFLEEIVRAVARGNETDLPEAVLVTIQARLDALEPEARRLLRAASVFGRHFHTEALESLLPDVKRPALRATLMDLVDREVLALESAGSLAASEVFGFRHALVRDAAYAMLPEDDRRFAHRAAGHWLAHGGLAGPAAVAQHFAEGGEARLAAAAFAEAAQLAMDSNDFREALVLVEKAGACGLDGAALGELEVLRAEAERWLGEHARAEEAAQRALDLLAPETASWYEALGELALSAGRIGHRDRLLEVVQSITSAPSPADSAARARRHIAASRVAIHLITSGSLDQAAPLSRELEAGADSDDPPVLARVHQTAAFVALLSGDLEGYLRRMRAATAAFEGAGDQREAAIQLVNVGNASAQLGDAAGAELALTAALAGARRMRLDNVVAYAEHNLGILLARRGQLEEGLALECGARDAFVQQGDRRMEGVARIYVAQISLLMSDYEAAIEEAARAEAILAQARPARACALATQAAALLAFARVTDDRDLEAVRVSSALRAARAGQDLLDDLGAIEEGEFLVRSTYVDALLAAGERDEATVRAMAAKVCLMTRAARIADAEVRARFLREVPDNARTVALSEQLLS